MTNWIIPCNVKYYNVESAFENLKRLDWKQSSKHMRIGDFVYIYVGAPVKAILYKCEVTKTNLTAIEIDDAQYVIDGEKYLHAPLHMELELIKKYDCDSLSYAKLLEHGLKGRIMGVRRMEVELAGFVATI